MAGSVDCWLREKPSRSLPPSRVATHIATWLRKPEAEPLAEFGRIDRFSPLAELGLKYKNTLPKAAWRQLPWGGCSVVVPLANLASETVLSD